MRRLKELRLLRRLFNIVLYSLAFCGLVLILIIIFVPKSPTTIGEVAIATQPKKLIILVPTNTPIPTGTSTPTLTPISTPTSAPTPTLTPLPVYLSRCLDVPEDKIHAIETGLTVDGNGYIDTKTAQAVRSGDFSKVFFIAAAIHGPGMGEKGVIGIWASNDLDPNSGLIFAIDAIAKEFTDWGNGQQTDANLSQFDDGGQEAEKCVEYKQSVVSPG